MIIALEANKLKKRQSRSGRLNQLVTTDSKPEGISHIVERDKVAWAYALNIVFSIYFRL